jgi:RimJ/RimL family protein N-acetyltransferase
MDLSNWQGVARPERVVLEGRYAKLEPLDARQHSEQLLASARQPGAKDRFRYLPDVPPTGVEDFTPWLENAATSVDPLFFAVIDRRTGRAEGRQALMRIDPAHGVIEIGHILWGPAIAGTSVATEALYLSASYVFDTLGYRRFEWKCNNHNEPSKRAAQRFGFTFEGIFRQHMVVKGQNRDTAWFAMTDQDWPRLKAGYEAWLRPENFDADMRQKSKLAF